MASAADTSTVRVGITAAFFQGPVKRADLPLSLGRVFMHLPGSKTEISFLLPDREVSRGDPQPLPFKVQKEGQIEQNREGLSLTVEKVKAFTMSVLVLEPGPKVGPKVMQPDGSVCQQETLRSSRVTVPVERPEDIQPGDHYKLMITSTDGSSATAELVKVDGPTKADEITAESPLVEAALALLEGPLKVAIAKTKEWIAKPLSQQQYPYCKNVNLGEFSRETARSSLVKVLESLHIETKAKLQGMSTADQKAELRKALRVENVKQVLGDQFKEIDTGTSLRFGGDQFLLGAVQREVVTPFIKAVKGEA